MADPPERDTGEVIEHLRLRRLRHRRRRVLLAAVATAVVLAAFITGVVLAKAAPNDEASSPTLSSVAGVTTTEETAASAMTTSGPVTTKTVTTEATPATTSTTDWLAGKVIVIDPGHQAHANSDLEPIGPGSTRQKAKVSSGTSSVLTGTPESEIALAVGLKLQAALEARGVKVVMTRTTQDVDISNIARARVGNNAGADLTVRLHANGGGDSSVHGLFTLYPASIKGWTDEIAAVSKKAATIAQRDLIAATGAQDRGLQERSDLTGFNWSEVPVILIEMGFMSNPTEDKQLRTAEYQDKIVQGLVQTIIEFLRTE